MMVFTLQDQLEESLNKSQLGNNYDKSKKYKTWTDKVYTSLLGDRF